MTKINGQTVIRPDGVNLLNREVILKDGMKVKCIAGNGCNPNAIGTKIFAEGLNYHLRRNEIMYVIAKDGENG